MLLEGKVAIVTGAGRGIGRATALGLAEAGAKVVVNDYGVSLDGSVPASEPANEVVATIEATGGSAVANAESVATLAGAERIVQTALDHFGRVDVLINVAGTARDRTLLNMTEEEFGSVIDVHIKGTFACTKAAATVMRGQGGGRIINVTSGAGFYGNVGQTNYSAAKAGIVGFTLAAAKELTRYNIAVLAIAPGPTKTRFTEGMEQALKARGQAVPELKPPDAIAPLMVYLALDETAYLAGQVIGMDNTGEAVSLWTRSEEEPRVYSAGGWTVERLREVFPRTIGRVVAAGQAPPAPVAAVRPAGPPAAK